MTSPEAVHKNTTSPAAVEQALLEHLPVGAVVSGHALRRKLLQDGCDKGQLVVTMQAMVRNGRIERLRVDEPDGRFFTAYRRTTGTGPDNAPGCGTDSAVHQRV